MTSPTMSMEHAEISASGHVTSASAGFVRLFGRHPNVLGAHLDQTRLPRLLPGLMSAVYAVIGDRAPRFRRAPHDRELGGLFVWLLPARRPAKGVRVFVRTLPP